MTGPRYFENGEPFDFGSASNFGFSGSTTGDVNPLPHPSQDDGNFGDGTYLARQNETPQYARGGRHKSPHTKAPPAKPSRAPARPPAIPPQQAAGAVAKALQIGKALGAAKAAMPPAPPPGGALNALAGPPPGAMPGGPPMGAPPAMARGGAVRDYDAEADIRATESRAKPGIQTGYARGGDVAQDKALVRKGIRQHENQEHGGKHSKLALARGGLNQKRD